MKRTNFKIDKMDCPCEENLIRMKLQENDAIFKLEFNLADRTLCVVHEDDPRSIAKEIETLNLDSSLISTEDIEHLPPIENDTQQGKMLWIVLAINFVFFLLEITTGIISQSMGLVADSLDMLADALVYGMSLWAVGAAVARKKRVALFSGYFQTALAVIGFCEVIRRFMGLEIMPDFQSMIGISALALIANSTCLWLLHRTQSRDAHMRASIIFSANDVIINAGVIIAGLLVWWLDSNLPDLIIGIVVFLIVIRGAIRILKLAR